MSFSLAIHIPVYISRYAFQRSTLVFCMVNEVYVSFIYKPALQKHMQTSRPNISNESIQTIGFTTFSTLTHTKYLRKHTSTISLAAFTILSHNLNTFSFNTTFSHHTKYAKNGKLYSTYIVHQIYCSHAK